MGMRAWRFRVVGADGAPASFKVCLLRFLWAFVLLLPFGFGLLWALWDRDKLALYDRVSRSFLIKSR